MKCNTLSLKQEFYIATFSIGFIIILTAFSFNILSSYDYKKHSFIQETKLQIALIADNSVAPMLFFDKEGTQTNLEILKKYPNILQVVIYDKEKNIFARFNPYNRAEPTLKSEDSSFFFISDVYTLKEEISVDNVNYGVLYLEKNTRVLKEFLEQSIENVLTFMLLLVLIITLFVIKTSHKLIDPIVELSQTLSRLSESTDYSIRLSYSKKNEIGNLYEAFNHLFISIAGHQQSRDNALLRAKNYQQHLEKLTNELEERVQKRTHELENSLNILKNTQSQLIESEKMAALGALVSGVAHEVNTPLGNAVTGSSIIKSESRELLRLLKSQELKKSTLEDTLEHLNETSILLMKSVNTAADLVRSFKQISVDQSIEMERKFNLHEYVDEIFLTFRNTLKRIPVKVEIDADEELYIYSYPGSFAQILNNFIQNSIRHGFEHKKDNATIKVSMHINNNTLSLIYEDNGEGIDASIKDKAFEPFITTKRNEGGTGLGLNIVYNIVSQKLKGSIVLESTPNEGVRFILNIPITS